MITESIIVAKRWDGLGGRLHAILNAWSVADALGLEFRFVWPRNAFIELHEPRELFSDTFVNRFEIPESACSGCVVQPDFRDLSLSAAGVLCRSGRLPMIEVSECFDVVAFATESSEAALNRFRRGFREIGWNRELHTLIQEESDSEYSAVHIRAGDIVTGAWRQFVPIEKYTPTPFVEFAVDNLSGHDCRPVVVVSDNDRYVRYLKTRSSMIRSPSDIVANYAELSEMQQAFTDILLLSRARRLVKPGMSAFSQLAAHLGSQTVQSLDDLMVEADAKSWFYEHIAQAEKEAERSHILHPLLARDICWFLDVFSDSLMLGEQMAFVDRAVGYDPGYCGALNRSAAALARVGNHCASARASLQAESLAAISDRHSDPLFESLATSISTQVFNLSTRPCRRQRRSAPRILASVSRRSENRIDTAAMLCRARRRLKKCERLTPFQIDYSDVLLNLRFQIAALTWLSAADDQLRTIVKKTIQSTENDPLFMSAWRPSGFTTLRKSGRFPQVLRNLEAVTVRVAHAIGEALSSPSQTSGSITLGHVDSMTTSPSGLQWVTGWVYDTKVGRNGLVVGYACHDTIVSGGLTFLSRPDVANVLKDRRALRSGFAFPVPLTVQNVVGDSQSNIRTQAAGLHWEHLPCERIRDQFGMAALVSRARECYKSIRGNK